MRPAIAWIAVNDSFPKDEEARHSRRLHLGESNETLRENSRESARSDCRTILVQKENLERNLARAGLRVRFFAHASTKRAQLPVRIKRDGIGCPEQRKIRLLGVKLPLARKCGTQLQ